MVSLDRPAISPVTVDWATTSAVVGNRASGGTSCSNTPDPDYVTNSGTLTFNVGDQQMTITVDICNDLRDERQNEWFEVRLSNVSPNASILDDSGRGQITDNDLPPQVSVAASPSSVDEGNPMEFKVTLNAVSELPILVDYAVDDRKPPNCTIPPATPPPNCASRASGDYRIDSPHSTSGTLSFPAGYTERIITVQALNDGRIENDETLEVTLTNPQNATLGTPATAIGTIVDYKPHRITIADASALEGQDLVFTVTVNPVLNQAITLDYVTADSTATAGADYTGVTTATQLTIPANTATEDITVPSLTDTLNEVADETFFVNLSNAGPANLVAFDDNTAVGTIQNVISRDLCILDAAIVAEGQALVFEVVLGEYDTTTSTCAEKSSSQTVTVDWETHDGTGNTGAVAPGDYVAVTSATLTFAPGETRKTLSVQTNNDQVYVEATEKLFVHLDTTSAQNAVVRDYIGEGEIANATRASISVNDASADEGNDLTFTVSATNLPATGNVTVDYTVSGLTASGPGTATGDDFDMKSPATATGTLIFTSSITSRTVTLSTESGDAYEPDETLRIDLSNPSGSGVLQDAVGIGTINQECINPTNSSHTPPTLSFRSGHLTGLAQTLGTADEGVQIPFAVTIDAPFCAGSGGGHFMLRATDVSTSSSDYTSPAATTGHKIGDVSTPTNLDHERQTVVYITTTDDQIDETDETFTLEVNWLDTGTNKMAAHYLTGISWVSTTATITDNDPLPNVSVADAYAAEGDDVKFTVSIDRESSRDVTLSYTTDVTGTGTGHAVEGTDYTRTRGSVTIAAGDTSAEVAVPTTADGNNEATETFKLDLTLTSTTTANLIDASAVGTINDSSLPVLTIHDLTVLEDVGIAQFTVSLSRPSNQQVQVSHRTVQLSSGDYATNNSDYRFSSGTMTFNSSQTTGISLVQIIEDTTAEKAERFHIVLSNPVNAVIGDGIGVVTIIDNDTACIDPTSLTATPPSLTVANASTAEAANNLAFTVTLSESFCADASLEVNTAGGTATGGEDYVSWSDTVTVPAYHTDLTWGIQVLDDTLVEADETFNLVVEWGSSMPTQYQAQPRVTAVGTITDDDGDLKVSVNDPAKVDEGSTVDFVVSLDQVAGRDVTVQYATSDCNTSNCAEAGKDYTAASGTVTIPAGDISAVVSVLTLTDTDATESDETFNLVLSSPTGAQLDDATGVGTIANVAESQISVADATAAEGTSLSFAVTLDKASTSVVSVDYATKDVTATAGADYSAVSGTLVFSPGDVSKTVTVATTADGTSEGAETMHLVLSSPVNASLADAIGVGTITNVDAPQLRVSDITVTEGATLSFEVALDKAATWDVVVPFTTKDGTAVQPGDYTASASTVTIAAGDTTASVPVLTVDDRLDENAETMRLELSATTDAVLADPIAVGTLFDNDALPTVSLASAKVTGDEQDSGGNAGSLSFTVQLSAASGRDVTVDYKTDDITATGGSDYTDTDGTLTFAAGSTSKQVSVPLLGDTEIETAEAFRFSLSNPTNATLGTPATAQGVILDDDTTEPSVLLRNHTPAAEGTPATVEVYLDRESTKVVTLYYSTSDCAGDGCATAGTDYTAAANTKITYGLREQTQTISIPTADDTDLEGDETFTVTLSNATNADIVDQSTTLTILDNDGDPTVSIGDASATEGGTATFTVSLSFAAKQEVTVAYQARVDGSAGSNSAVPGSDFTATSGTLTFAVGDTSKTISVATIQDVFDEADETFWVQLTSATGATVVDGTGQGVILDDDPLPTLSVGDATASEGDAVVFAVTLSTASGRDVTATYATAAHSTGQDPATPGTDYTAAPGTLRIPAGSTSTTISVATIDDDDAEHDETFLVKIDNPANAQVADGTGQGTIIDTDGLPRLSVADLSLFEDEGPAQFAVSLSHASPDDDVTVGYRTVACSGDGCAVSGTDYTFTSGTLTISAGDNSGTIDVPIIDDIAEEDDETFTLQLVSPTNATILDQDATATILDNDGDPRITVADVTVDEDIAGGTLDFTVTLSHAADTDVTVDYATFDRTATQPYDYVAAAGTLTIPKDDTTATISVTIINDNLTEGETTLVRVCQYGEPWVCERIIRDYPDWGDPYVELPRNIGSETFLLRLDSPTGATLDDAEATGEITDDEDLPRVGVTEARANEDEGHIVFTPTLSHPSIHTVTARYGFESISNSCVRLSLPGCVDPPFDTSPGDVSFPPGTTSVSLPIPVYDNTYTSYNPNHWIHYNNATFSFKLTSPVVNGTGYASVFAIIWDDETAPYMESLDGVDVAEDAGNAVFTLTLNRISDVPVTVAYRTTTSGTATAGSDYTAVDSTVTFPAGTQTATVSVPIIDDSTDESSETVALEIYSSSSNSNFTFGAVGDDRTGTVTIIDDDETPRTVHQQRPGL